MIVILIFEHPVATTVCIDLCMLDGARLHIHLLIAYLLHLVSVCLLNEGLDRV